MILVNKECSECDKVSELTFIPKDMVNESFKCPYCREGTVTYVEDI